MVLDHFQETAKEEVDKIVVTDAPLFFPPGQLALAALRHANEVHRVLDYERYLENMLIRQNSIHSSTELIQHLNVIDSSVRTYKFPSEKVKVLIYIAIFPFKLWSCPLD
ncbi:cyclin-H1-1-like isoform X2 [Eucalyptus grandis]|uniref:cyclin-H1-1-like isoform X2 n=1 Tax=Eucalyptus grandis TaxID=71139 RepID=UPI00192E852D|nr:cyclin-H1-1-like isoform X2 [Eucalyptus grandis]